MRFQPELSTYPHSPQRKKKNQKERKYDDYVSSLFNPKRTIHLLLTGDILTSYEQKRYVLQSEYARFLKQSRESEKSKKRYNNPIRRARRWKRILHENPELNNTLLAKRLRFSRVSVVHVLSLLRLPEWAQGRVLDSTRVSERSHPV